MSKVTIYHNPRCSKSRATLEILENHLPADCINIVPYLETAPDISELRTLHRKLGVALQDMVRKGETIYSELNLANTDEATLYAAIAEHPILLERPIVVRDASAVIGRPPENVLKLLDAAG